MNEADDHHDHSHGHDHSHDNCHGHNHHHDHSHSDILQNHQKKTSWVLVISCVAMVAEIVAGYITGSMALLADGWHMASHVGAMMLSVLAYAFARREKFTARLAFGPGKIFSLAGYTSGILLLGISAYMVIESVLRLVDPTTIRYGDAILVAAIGFAVNILSAVMLHHDHAHSDHNIRSAYLHVLTDALTSLLALGALFAGRYLGWAWFDPVSGIVGSVLVARWSWSLLKDTSRLLLDATPEHLAPSKVESEIAEAIGRKIKRMHIWALDSRRNACIIVLDGEGAAVGEACREKLEVKFGFAHLVIDESAHS